MIISLIGFMGCGKSSVGRRLSELLCCHFSDLDDVIEEQTGKSIAEIFESDGEEAFRKMEYEALKGIAGKIRSEESANYVMALGGGTVMREECAKIVHDGTLCIYLRTSVDMLTKNLEGKADARPMLASGTSLRERVQELHAFRSSTYEKTAHIIIDTDGQTVEDLAIRSFHLVRGYL